MLASFRLVEERRSEGAHSFEVFERPHYVAPPQPLGGPPMPARRCERLARLLPVMGEEGGLLVELLGVGRRERARHRRMRATPALLHVRAEGHLLRQRVLEGVLGPPGRAPARTRTRAPSALPGRRAARRLQLGPRRAGSAPANSLPITAAACSTCFSRSGNRSMRAASTAWTDAGTARRSIGASRR